MAARRQHVPLSPPWIIFGLTPFSPSCPTMTAPCRQPDRSIWPSGLAEPLPPATWSWAEPDPSPDWAAYIFRTLFLNMCRV